MIQTLTPWLCLLLLAHGALTVVVKSHLHPPGMQGHIKLYSYCAHPSNGKAIVIYLSAHEGRMGPAFQRTGLTVGSKFLLRRPLCGTQASGEVGEGGGGAAGGGPRGEDHVAFELVGAGEAIREGWSEESKLDPKTLTMSLVPTVWWEARPIALELVPLHSVPPQVESARRAEVEAAGGKRPR